MSAITKGFIRASLIYLVVGVLMGVLFMFRPIHEFIEEGPGGALIWVHAHLNLVGFVSMMIFGVAYHILPRFSGRPLHSERMAYFHLFLANIGLIGMVISWTVGALYGGILFHGGVGGEKVGLALAPFLLLALAFGIILAASFLLFVYNIFRTVK